MYPNHFSDKCPSNSDNSVLQRGIPCPNKLMVGVPPVNDENTQNLRIQMAVNRYNSNSLPPPRQFPSSSYRCSVLNSKPMRPRFPDDVVSQEATNVENALGRNILYARSRNRLMSLPDNVRCSKLHDSGNVVASSLLDRSANSYYNRQRFSRLKTVGTDLPIDINRRADPEFRYTGPNNFPTCFVHKSYSRLPPKYNIRSALKSSPRLAVNSSLDDLTEKYSDVKSTRSVLDVLQDLSRKRIHGKDEPEENCKRRKGLGGDDIHEDGEVIYKPLFIPKPRSPLQSKKDQSTQTLEPPCESPATTPVQFDSKWEIRRKLALRNNEISASLSSSVTPKRIKVSNIDSNGVEDSAFEKLPAPKTMEPRAAESAETPNLGLETNDGKLTSVRTVEKSPKTPTNNDRLNSIFYDLKNSPDAKLNAMKAMQINPGECQFERPAGSEKETQYGDSEISGLPKSLLSTSSLVSKSTANVKAASLSSDPTLPSLTSSPPKMFGMPTTALTTVTNPVSSTETPISFESKVAPSVAVIPNVTLPTFSLSTPTVTTSTLTKPISSPSDPISIFLKKDSGNSAPIGAGFFTPLAKLASNSLNTSKENASPVSVVHPTTSAFTFGTGAGNIANKTSEIVPAFKVIPPKTDEVSLLQPPIPNSGQSPKQKSDCQTSAFQFGNDNLLKTDERSMKSLNSHQNFSFNNSNAESPTIDIVKNTIATSPMNKVSSNLDSPISTSFSLNADTSPKISQVPKPTGSVFSRLGAPGEGNIQPPSFTFGLKKTEPVSSSASNVIFGGFNVKDEAVLSSTSVTTMSNFPTTIGSSMNTIPTNLLVKNSSTPSEFNFRKESGVKTTNANTITSLLSGSDDGNKNLFAFGQTSSAAFGTTSSTNSNINSLGPLNTTSPAIASTATGTSFSGFRQTASTNAPFFGVPVDSQKQSLTPTVPAITNPVVNTTSDSLFAQNASTTLFGQPFVSKTNPTTSNQSGPTTGSLFSQPSVASEVFGLPAGNSAVPAMFGQLGTAQLPAATSAGTIFGQVSTNLFGQTTTATSTSSNMFSQSTPTTTPMFTTTATATTTVASMFGLNTASNTLAPVFGTATVPSNSTPLFVKPNVTTLASVTSFNSTTNTPSFGQQTGSTLFGPSTTAAPMFAQTTVTTTSPSFHTPSVHFGSAAFSQGTTDNKSMGFTFGQSPHLSSTSTTTASAFGASTTTTTTFGSNTAPPTFGALSSAPAFGSSPTPASFGATTAVPTFGSTTASPSFGTPVTTAPPTFGQSSSAFTFVSSNTPSTFGQPQVAGFGQSVNAASTVASSPFTQSTPSFGAPSGQQTTTGAFGTIQSAPAFGQTQSAATPFGAAANPSPSSNTFTFGKTATPSTQPFMFGNSQNQPSTFGNPATPGFGVTTPMAASSPFGSSTGAPFGATTPAVPPATTSAPFSFGAAQTNKPVFNFGSTTSQTPAPFPFGSVPTPSATPTGFNFNTNTGSSASSGGFNFSAGNFAQTTPSPFGQSSASSSAGAFPTNFAMTPSPGAFTVPGIFSIGSGTTQPRSRATSRVRRRN